MDLSLNLLSVDKQVKDWSQPAHVACIVGALVSTGLGKQREKRWDMSTGLEASTFAALEALRAQTGPLSQGVGDNLQRRA